MAYIYVMKKFVLAAAFPCVVTSLEGSAILEEGVTLEFDSPARVFIYPASGRREDVAFVFDMSNPSPRARIFSLPETEYFYLDSALSSVSAREKLSIDKNVLTFTIANDNLTIDDGSLIKVTPILKPKTYEITTLEHLAIVKIHSLGAEQLVIYNPQTASIRTITGDKIEIIGSEIICEIGAREEKYNIIEENLIKTKSISSISRNNKIIGMRFLEHIKNGEYSSAASLLDNSLSSSEEKLVAYFGQIRSYIPLDKNHYGVITSSNEYILRLDTSDAKITNIEILD